MNKPRVSLVAVGRCALALAAFAAGCGSKDTGTTQAVVAPPGETKNIPANVPPEAAAQIQRNQAQAAAAAAAAAENGKAFADSPQANK